MHRTRSQSHGRARNPGLVCSALLAMCTASLPASAVTKPVERVLHSFSGTPDADYPGAGLMQGSDGYLYGTSSIGGTSGMGAVFRIDPFGNETVVHSFYMDTGSEGVFPNPGMIEGSDGALYGTTADGGTSGDGTVFKMYRSGAVITLHSFKGAADGYGSAGLVEAADGSFYGTSNSGGSNGQGTLYRLTPTGAFTVLYAFSGGADGAWPLAGLTQGSDGNLYGTTLEGGIDGGMPGGCGTIFRITTEGVKTGLHSFTCGDDGYYPQSRLVQGNDGAYYGTAIGGGTYGFGTVFRITPAGEFTVLHSFTGKLDGEYPFAGLFKGPDGRFYGSAQGGGANKGGTVFVISMSGKLAVLHSFGSAADGDEPVGALAVGRDGAVFGTTYYGGSFAHGVAYKIR